MACPHSKIGDPARCSQCIGATVRRVDTEAGAMTIDGVPTGRAVAPPPWHPGVEVNRRRAARRKAQR